MGYCGPTHQVSTFLGSMDDLHICGVRQVVYTGNCPVIWSVSLYHIGSESPVHGSVLDEFLEGHGDTDEDEHSVSSADGQTVKVDYPGFGGHAVSIRPGLQGWLR